MTWGKKEYDGDVANIEQLKDVTNLQQLREVNEKYGYTRTRYERMDNFLRNVTELKGLGLELAFGFGSALLVIVDNYPDIIMDAFDWSDSMAKLIPIFERDLKGRVRKVWQGSCESIPMPDNTYDFVDAQSIFEHLTDDQYDKTLKECYRVLKPGGLLGVWVDQTPDKKQHTRCKPHDKAAAEVVTYGFKKITNHVFRKPL